MKLLLVYWLVGCWVVGTSLALRLNACPADKLDSAAELLALVAIWPIGLAASFSLPKDYKFHRVCESAPP
jgi:hypothetical protein